MSQDKFWEQWGAGGQAPDKSGEPQQADQNAAGEEKEALDADVLSAWLQALPPNDPLVPAVPVTPPAPPSNPGDLANLWPPAAPVDPFTGIQPSPGSSASDWDLAFDDDPIAPAPSGADPNLAGPIPAANPFAATAGAPAEAPAPPPPVISPFGPPPPPAAPPAEVLGAAPLKLVVTTGRRTNELTVQGEALIGRPDATRGLHPEIDLRLDDAVSRRHAKIFVSDGRYVLKDLNSTNGTRHNQQWLQPEVEVPLKVGDEIEVGEHTLIRVLEAPEPDA